MLQVYLYTDIPRAGKGWTVAITAVNKRDADRRKRLFWRGGRCVGQARPGSKVQAHCGDVTDAAKAVLRQELERFMNYQPTSL